MLNIKIPPSNYLISAESHRHLAESPKWYAIYTRSHFEKKVCENLRKVKCEVFLPLIKEKRLWSDRFKTVWVPLLPSYVFVKLSLEAHPNIYYQPGVVRIVTFEGKPCEVRDEEIRLLENIVKHGFAVENTNHVGVGDCVRIVRGPLKGWEGRVEDTRGQSRIMFHIQSIQQCISVEVNMSEVERI